MSSPFDYVNQILYGNKQLIVDEITEQGYKPFLVNRSLSYQKDCVFYANEMNRFHHLDNKLQNDFLLNTIRKSKRPFAKWVKAEKSNDIECISMVYGISSLKAREVLQILTQEQLKKIKETADIGGVGKK